MPPALLMGHADGLEVPPRHVSRRGRSGWLVPTGCLEAAANETKKHVERRVFLEEAATKAGKFIGNRPVCSYLLWDVVIAMKRFLIWCPSRLCLPAVLLVSVPDLRHSGLTRELRSQS